MPYLPFQFPERDRPQLDKISTIIPIGPGLRDLTNLRKSLASIATFRDVFEVIIVKDSTHSSTNDELEKITSEITFALTIVETSCGNPGGARNLGKSRATGTWIHFCDSDDVVDFQEIYGLSLISKTSNSDLVVGKYESVNINDGVKKQSSELGSIFELCFEVGLWRVLFRKEICSGIQFDEISMAEDQNFIDSILFESPTVKFTDINVYQYYKGADGQLTKSVKAFADLTKSILILLARKQKPEIKFIICRSILISRQTISLAKHTNWKQVFSIVQKITSNFKLKYLMYLCMGLPFVAVFKIREKVR